MLCLILTYVFFFVCVPFSGVITFKQHTSSFAHLLSAHFSRSYMVLHFHLFAGVFSLLIIFSLILWTTSHILETWDKHRLTMTTKVVLKLYVLTHPYFRPVKVVYIIKSCGGWIVHVWIVGISMLFLLFLSPVRSLRCPNKVPHSKTCLRYAVVSIMFSCSKSRRHGFRSFPTYLQGTSDADPTKHAYSRVGLGQSLLVSFSNFEKETKRN